MFSCTAEVHGRSEPSRDGGSTVVKLGGHFLAGGGHFREMTQASRVASRMASRVASRFSKHPNKRRCVKEIVAAIFSADLSRDRNVFYRVGWRGLRALMVALIADFCV